MNDTKKLIFAIVAGAGASVLCCVAFTSFTSSHSTQGQEVKIGYEADAQPSAPSAPAVADSKPPMKSDTKPDAAETSPVTTRRTRTANAGKVAVGPRRRRAASNASALSAITRQPAVAQPELAASGGDANVPARTVTAQEARAALKELGANPAAEAVWIAAINDANMPAAQRKDLIEDLNEEGFADPKHLTAADLPRIEGRLALIEELAPQAADQTNADAFQEAYKDLNDMRARLVTP